MIIPKEENPLQFKMCPQCKKFRDVRVFDKVLEICICCEYATTPQYIADYK